MSAVVTVHELVRAFNLWILRTAINRNPPGPFTLVTTSPPPTPHHLSFLTTNELFVSLEEAWGDGLEVAVAAGPQEQGYGVWGLQLRCLGVYIGGISSSLDTHPHDPPSDDRAKRSDQKVLFFVRYRGVRVVLRAPSVREIGRCHVIVCCSIPA